MSLKIKMYQAGCGDAIWVSFHDETSSRNRNILIDSGFMLTYYMILRFAIANIPEDEVIDLWILTHLDDDHINGAAAFFRSDPEIIEKSRLQELWFNYFDRYYLPDNTNKLSMRRAVNLRDTLIKLGIPCKREIVNDIPVIHIGEAKVTILSPDREIYHALGKDWEAYESESHSATGPELQSRGIVQDDLQPVHVLAKRPDRPEDKGDIPNASSIAFLLEYRDQKVLFLADAHASVVNQSLKKLLTDRGESRLRVDYIKLGHHGSIKNFSQELLSLTECYNFLISSNGENKDRLPNKEVLAKILYRQNRERAINFYFNYQCSRYDNMFNIDKNAGVEYNFNCFYPGKTNNHIEIQ